MSGVSTVRRSRRSTMTKLYRRLPLALGIAVGLTAVSLAPAQSASAHENARGQIEFSAFWPPADDDVVLPTRVAAAVARTQDVIDRVVRRLDDSRYAAGRRSLATAVVNLNRTHRAGMAQMTATPVDPEAETTPGPDSVVAVLTLEQAAITNLAGVFDGITGHPLLVAGIDRALATADSNRNLMLDAVAALDPEEAGADYSDGMADTVDGYTDEIANLTEALHDDQLSVAGRTALTNALARSQATAAKVTTAFGGED
jgi:hypothetical protein